MKGRDAFDRALMRMPSHTNNPLHAVLNAVRSRENCRNSAGHRLQTKAITLGTLDDGGVLADAADLFQDRTEAVHVRVAEETVVGQLDDRLAGRLGQLRIIQVLGDPA